MLWFVSAQAISFAQDPIVDPIEIEWRQLNPSRTELLNKGLSAIDLGEYKDANSSIKPNVSMDGGGFNYRSQSNSSLITLSPQYSKQTGFAIGGVFAKSITDNAALGVIFNAGADRNEWLVNAGYDINQNQRVILSLGQLRQNLEFNFQSGLEKTQVTQNNGALSYQYLLGKSWLNAAEFNAYISDTPSINLTDKTWYTNTDSLYELWNDPRRIAGAKVEGVQSRLVFTPTTKTTLKLGLGAEHLSYDLSLGKDTYTRATGSAEFNQRLDNGFNLNASANLASSQNRFGLALSRSFKDGQQLSVDALAIRGRDNTFDDNLITFNFTQTFGGVKSNVAAMNMQDVEIKSASSNASQKDLANNDANPKANWVSNLVNAVAKRPTFLPSQVNAKIDTTASSTRLIAIDKTGIPTGSTIENATGILTVPIKVGGSDVPVSAIAGITKNGSAFTNSGQFALSGSTYLMINPNLITQPATTDTYIVTMTNVSGGGTTLATITVSHGSTRIDSVVISSGTIVTVLSNFATISKTYGAAAFTLTPPTTNNLSGAFTYTSSNTSVATISGTTVTVIGAGTSTITATQAANGNYSSATISATLTVTAATPTLSGLSLSSSSVVFGAAAPTINAPTSASSGAITYASSDTSVATISGSTITIVGVGSTTITATQAANGNYTSTTTPTSLTVTASTVATLSNLTIVSGTLSPVFASGTISYSASVSNATTSVTVTPTVTNSNSTVKVNGVTVASGVASGAISLNEGANTITTVVTAQDGTTTKTYTITVTRAGAAVSVNYLIVAGGGGGGNGVGGGGGAGGLLASTTSLSSGVTYTISVGSGGLKGSTGVDSGKGGNGGNSYISGTDFTTITAIGGGGGGSNNSTNGSSGSGGSSGGRSDPRAGSLGAATVGQGNIGGQSEPGWGGYYGAGGGGGAGAVGSNYTANGGGAGGAGLSSNITGTTVYYAGGGGGGTFGGTGGAGGIGGGGNSTNNSATANGTDGTGGGGGGSWNNGNNPGAGGKGVVILSIPTARYSGNFTGSPVITINGANTVLTFNANGSYAP